MSNVCALIYISLKQISQTDYQARGCGDFRENV